MARYRLVTVAQLHCMHMIVRNDSSFLTHPNWDYANTLLTREEFELLNSMIVKCSGGGCGGGLIESLLHQVG